VGRAAPAAAARWTIIGKAALLIFSMCDRHFHF
jgi:hypothetical protein